MSLLAACGDSQPLSDIDVTVEARVAEEHAAEATVEAKAQYMAQTAPKRPLMSFQSSQSTAHPTQNY